jgi:predicted nucleotidyltransferase
MADERRRAEEFAERLRGAFGDALVSVVLYGSAARGDFREGVSNLNLLVLVRSADAATLRLGSALAREWVKAGNPPPLILDEAEWRGSADVFPIEYSDMLDAHVVVQGSDPFEGLSIEWSDLRLQCEHELKTKQIQLREHYLLAADSPPELGQLLRQSFPTFLTLFRTALRLASEEVPRPPEAVLSAAARRVGFDAAPFLEVLKARQGGGKFEPAGDGSVVEGYLDGVERATVWLDGLGAPGRTG